MEAKLKAFLRQVDPAVSLVVLCDGQRDEKGFEAVVEEHYDCATIDPERILVRRDDWKSLAAAEEEASGHVKTDLAGICDLFLQEKRFCVYPLKKPPISGTRTWQEGSPRRTSGMASEEYGRIIENIKKTYGEFLPFFQSLFVQHLYPLLLTDKPCRAETFDTDLFLNILKQIDDDIICRCGCIPEDVLVKVLSFKYGVDIQKRLAYRNGKLTFENLRVVSLKEIPFVVEQIACTGQTCKITGNVMLPLEDRDVTYYFADNANKRHEIEWEDGEELFFLGQPMRTRKRFTAVMKVGGKPTGMRFMYSYKNMYNARLRMVFSEKSGMTQDGETNAMIQPPFFLKMEKRILFIAPLKLATRVKFLFTFPFKRIRMYISGKR